jgi:membrane-associated phospholipid phosphatase
VFYLTNAYSAYAVCLPNVLPAFSTFVFANGSQQQDCEPVPVQLTALGSNFVGGADATATSSLHPNAKVDAVYTSPIQLQGASEGFARTDFQDQFRFLVPGTSGPAFLSFTLSLTGSITTVGLGSTGSVGAGLSLADQFFNTGSGHLDAPGTEVIELPVIRGVEEFINATGGLTLDAVATAPGSVTLDFSDTFEVAKIQLLDTSGGLLEDNIILMDAAGNTLGGPSPQPPPPPPGVPEPSSALLLAAGLGLLAAVRRRVRALLVGVIALAVGIAAAHAGEQIEPNAGSWKTWVIASGRDFRIPPPPNDAAAEIAELKALAGQRHAKAAELIAYWNVGPPSYRWQQIALDEVMRNSLPWQWAVRDFALMHAAIYDAMVAAWDSKYAYNRKRPSEVDAALVTALPNPQSPSYPAEHAVAAGAAAAVLSYLFPDRATYFAGKAEEAGRSRVLAGVQYPSDVGAGLELGHKVAAAVIERGKADGTDAKWTGSVPAGPGKWNGTNPILPQMAMWETWVLDSPSEFRSPPPPAYDSPEKAAELAEIKNFPRTPKTNSAAYFWEYAVGGLRGHQYWAGQINRLALEYQLADAPPRAARAYALHDIAVIDAGIACWDGKYTYWAIRPVQLDPEVKPLFATPNHPSYPAAHGCFSRAQAGILGYLFPRDAEALSALAEEAAESRVWAGIHYRSDIVAGAALGRAVAAKVIDRAKQDGSQSGQPLTLPSLARWAPPSPR